MTEIQYLFNVPTPMGFRVRTTPSHWQRILKKHGDMLGREGDVSEALMNPDEVRRSSWDPEVCLFYKLQYGSRYICALGKPLNGDGKLVTAYQSDSIKVGDLLWRKE